MLAKIENGVPVQWPLGDYFIRATHPNTSFPDQISDETLLKFGFSRFQYQSPPPHDSELQEAREVAPVLNGAVATQAWEIVEKYTAEEKAAYIAKRDSERLDAQKASVRAERNTLLSACDWTQVLDAPVDKTAWATYRQALRDITSQAGFPWTIDWPVKPE